MSDGNSLSWAEDLLMTLNEDDIEELKQFTVPKIPSTSKVFDVARQEAKLQECLERRHHSHESPTESQLQQHLTDEMRRKLIISGKTTPPMAPPTGHAISSDNRVECAPTFGTQAAAPPRPLLENPGKRAAVYKLLARELRGDWRVFGTALHIRQGAMDSIELEFPNDLESCTCELLQLFEHDKSHDPMQTWLIICRALDACRRQNLRYKVETMLLRLNE